MADDIILQTRGLTKEFKGFVAINGVDLEVRRGTIHALIGPNGAGKTTCFNLLTHFLTPTSGQILFNGRSIYPVRDFWRTYSPPFAAYYMVLDRIRQSAGGRLRF